MHKISSLSPASKAKKEGQSPNETRHDSLPRSSRAKEDATPKTEESKAPRCKQQNSKVSIKKKYSQLMEFN